MIRAFLGFSPQSVLFYLFVYFTGIMQDKNYQARVSCKANFHLWLLGRKMCSRTYNATLKKKTTTDI